MPVVAGEVRNGKVISAAVLKEIERFPYNFAIEQFLMILFMVLVRLT